MSGSSKDIVQIPSDGWVLHGVAHLPGPAAPAAQGTKRVGVVLLHENNNTKFGTHRLYYILAEALANAGFYVLRHDNRGTNDSEDRCDLSFPFRVADAAAANVFFRQRYGLDQVVGWGLCMGGAVAVHCAAAAKRKDEGFDGLILCNILAHPSDATLPELGFQRLDTARLGREMFLSGNLIEKILSAPKKLHVYRQNLPKIAAALFGRFFRRVPELDRLKAEVARVGELLVAYPGPSLMIFGEKDWYRTSFYERVNAGDRLGLARKRLAPRFIDIKDGDHTFSSAEQTGEMIRITLEWLQPLRDGRFPGEGPRPVIEASEGSAPEGST